MRAKLFLALICFSLYGTALSQPQTVGVMPMKYNPSFAGSANAHRFVSIAEIKGGENYGIGFSYDNFIAKLSSGVGFYINYNDSKYNSIDDVSSMRSSINTTRSDLHTGLILSPKISIKGKYTLAPSVGINYRRFDYYRDYFYSGRYTDATNSDTLEIYSERMYGSFGVLFNTKKFYIGYAYVGRGLSKNDYDNFYVLPFETNTYFSYAQIGYTFQKKETSKFSLTTQAVYMISMHPRNSGGPSFNICAKYKVALLGLGGTGPYIGFQNKFIRLIYLQNYSAGSKYTAEISCRIIIPNKIKATINSKS